MAEPTNSNLGAQPRDESASPSSRQETILLSDVPTATQLTQEFSAPTMMDPSLSTAALAALSQRYDIIGEAGHGAMGNVYKARDRETSETVALKLLKPEIASDQAMMERFKNELLFARKITHKNVCRVHEFNRIGNLAFTTMEFVEGESLRSVLNRFGGFPLRKGLAIASQICSGLQEAHAQGIVHRDLKPENVMIDANGNVKIMDFGIARSMEALTRLTGAMIGTPAYMAPEQVAGKPVDYRTDIYSLGLMLYEMFTGSQAFQAETAVAIALKQMRETPPAPHEVEPTIPVAIERVILKCLEKDPSRRYQSVAELGAALRAPSMLGSNPSALTPIPVASPIRATPEIPKTASTPKSAPRRASPFLWIILGALAVLAVMAGLRAKATWQSAENVAAPAQAPTPAPPEIALKKVITEPTLTKPAKETPPPARSNGHGQPSSAAAVTRTVPSDVQKRADRAFSQAETAEGENRRSYLWVGRFGKEDGAQKAAKKIEDLGLPVVVMPRHGPNGEFFVVFSGPFNGNRVPSVTQWLESQGFRNVRPIREPYGAAKTNNNQSQ
jgi:serine/threonine protein kinase